MLSQSQRTTILELNASGVSRREIARVLRVSRLSVRKVLRSNSASVPEIHRAEKAEPYREQILELSLACKGNLVRVHEELLATGAMLSYTALTAFCRRHGIGEAPAWCAWARDDRQHGCDRAAGHGQGDDPCGGDGGLCRALRLSLRGT